MQRYTLLIIAGILILFSACSDSEDSGPVVLKGHLDISGMPGEFTGPLFVAVLDDMPLNFDGADLTSVIKITSVNSDTLTFSLDLSETDLSPGDTVVIVAFQDKNFTGTPSVDTGDVIGFYTNPETFSPEYTLPNNTNSDLEIRVNREVFSFDSMISGTISGTETGTVTVIAYAGEINSLDFSQFNPDEVIGYTTLVKTEPTVAYEVAILPFGWNIPVENVSLIALLDSNENSIIDAGDPIAIYSDVSGFPAVLTIPDGHMDGYDLEFSMELSEPSGYGIRMEGRFDTGAEFEGSAGERFVIVMRPDPSSTSAPLSTDLSSLSFFYKVPRDTSRFNFDLSGTNLFPGDQVMVIALADHDYAGGFPSLTPGDFIGFYQNKINYRNLVVIREGVNTIQPSDEWMFEINRQVYSFAASLSGTVSGPETGSVTIVAYAGEINSLDFTKFSPLDIIGFTTIEKKQSSEPYSLSVLPYGKDVPIQNVYLFAVLDANANGLNDAGDKIGYLQDDQGLPQLQTISEGNKPDLDILFSSEIPTPSGHAITMVGEFELAEPFTGNSGERFVIITDAEASDKGYGKLDFSTIRYFLKLPHQTNSFEIDLSATALSPGDDVMVSVLQDNDYTAGFPSISSGDYYGSYQNTIDFQTAVTLDNGLTAVIPSEGWTFEINRKCYDHQATIAFGLDDSTLTSLLGGVKLDPGEHVTVYAVHEDGVTTGLRPSIDMNYVIGLAPLTVPMDGNHGHRYEMNVLPAIYHKITVRDPFSIPNVYILAVFDGNTSDSAEKNNYLGYYWKRIGLLRLMTPYPLIENKENLLDKNIWFSTIRYSF